MTEVILGKTRLEPVCERIAALRPQFEALAERWSGFQRRESELHTQLVKSASDGISSRRSSDKIRLGEDASRAAGDSRRRFPRVKV